MTWQGCMNQGSGTRRIEAQIVAIPPRKEQDWHLLCETTPMTWNHITYKGPTRCESRVSDIWVPLLCDELTHPLSRDMGERLRCGTSKMIVVERLSALSQRCQSSGRGSYLFDLGPEPPTRFHATVQRGLVTRASGPLF